MKDGIHPTYYPAAAVTCACGNSFTVGSTSEKISVEVCSNCHPFYTGKQRLMDVAGRLDKFRHRQEESAKLAAKTKTSKPKKTGHGKSSRAKITKLG